METTFFGLYGVSSPLPGFYTEELFDAEWDDESSSKGFLDIIHYKLFPLLYQAWEKYRFNLNAVENNKEQYWSILFSLIGLDKDFRSQLEKSGFLLKYAGLLGMHPKSKMGLQTILADMFEGLNINIEQFVPRNVKIENHQRCLLGQQNIQLGEMAVVGESVIDVMGQFKIQIGPVDNEQFETILNDSSYVTKIKLLTHLFIIQPLVFQIELLLEQGAEQNITLGENSSMLGKNTWVGVTDNMPGYSVRLA